MEQERLGRVPVGAWELPVALPWLRLSGLEKSGEQAPCGALAGAEDQKAAVERLMAARRRRSHQIERAEMPEPLGTPGLWGEPVGRPARQDQTRTQDQT